MINILLILILLGAGGYLGYRYFQGGTATKKDKRDFEDDRFREEVILEFIKESFNDILKTNLYDMNLSKEEYKKRARNKSQLRKALKTCTYGDLNAKNYVKDFIKDMLIKKYQLDDQNINRIINFNSPKELKTQDKFEILLHIYKKNHGYEALTKIIMDHNLEQPKSIHEEGHSFIITTEEIEAIYKTEVKKIRNFHDKLDIIVQRLYQRYKGYGVIDEIRDMKIDGISGGVSGIPSSFFKEMDFNAKVIKTLPSAFDSVWIFFKGKQVHLSFLSFGSERELIRVCKNIYRYNNPGQLSESNGYKVNEMKDGSRIVVARPPFCESWVFFVRKFDSASLKDMRDLVRDDNADLPIETIKWLVKGCRVTAVTGQQGTGKTTLMMSIVKFIDPSYTLRIQEMAFELHLRNLYPYRNIVSFRETTSISGQEGLDLQKKTDGTVNILGEVATAPVASWMIQMAQVGSLFTMFTHHAKTSDDLVVALRNCLLQIGVFNQEKIAETQVADVINFDIHLNKDITGHRYIERITEIVPLSTNKPYPMTFKEGKTHEDKVEGFMETMAEYFARVTDRKTFETRDVVRWINGKFEVAEGLSPRSIKAIKRHLNQQEEIEFNKYLQRLKGDDSNVVDSII